MNPLTNVKNLNKLNERELAMGLSGTGSSWHNKYKDSSWIFVGGLPYDLTEGDVVCIFSQYGELVNINMIRDKQTGKTRGFAFICYEDQRSTILAVDNFNGTKVLGRTLRVDHVEEYKVPKDNPKHEIDEITKQVRKEGIAPQAIVHDNAEEDEEAFIIEPPQKTKKKLKKVKKEKKKKKRKKRDSSSNSSESEDVDSDSDVNPRKHGKVKRKRIKAEIKDEKIDAGYDKYATYNSLSPRDSKRRNNDLIKQKSFKNTSRRRYDSDSSDGRPVRLHKRDLKQDKEIRHERKDDSDYSSDERNTRNHDRHGRGGSRRDRSRERQRERDNSRERRRGRSRERSRERGRSRDKSREKYKDSSSQRTHNRHR